MSDRLDRRRFLTAAAATVAGAAVVAFDPLNGGWVTAAQAAAAPAACRAARSRSRTSTAS